MERLDFNTIKKFTRQGSYCVCVELRDFKYSIDRYIEKYNLEMNPDFQRGHVWTTDQQVKFIEFILKGGKTEPIQFNHTNWMNGEGEMVCVDGLQRTTAILKFLNDELEIFDGYKLSQIDNLTLFNTNIYISVNNLKTRKEVLQWYIELNDGGTPHTKSEIEKVKRMLNIETEDTIVIGLRKYDDILTEDKSEEVYNEIKNALNNSNVIIDLDGIYAVAIIFAERVFGKLYLELGSDKYFERITFENCQHSYIKIEIRSGIEKALKNESLDN
jgi:uncharacterized protein with ParB-like and HNH nuclease domain